MAVVIRLIDTVNTLNTKVILGSTIGSLPLVNMVHEAACLQRTYLDPLVPDDDGKLYYLIQQYQMISAYLNWKISQLEEGTDENFVLRNHVKYLNDLLDILERKACPVALFEFTQLILDVWTYTHAYTYTYRALIAILSFLQIENTPDQRQNTVEMIREISQTWPD